MIKPIAWIVVGVLLAINVGIRLPGLRNGIDAPLVMRTYGATGAGFSLAFPVALSMGAAVGAGAFYAGSADSGRLAVAVTVMRFTGSRPSPSPHPHAVCGMTYSQIESRAAPSVRVIPTPSYCLEDFVAVRDGIGFSVTVLSSEGSGPAEAVAASFRPR